MAASRVLHLPIDASHALGASELEDRHSDPVDRLLVSHAKAETMRFVTADASFAAYDIEVLDATK